MRWARFGRLEGDVNEEGPKRRAEPPRAQLFLDYFDNPTLARRLLDVSARTISAMASFIRGRTGTIPSP
jgi:hypothetical protein